MKVDSTNKDSDATANRKNGHKQKYTTLDLPYPPGGKNSENWKLLNAMLISWAGAQEDPFGTNGRLNSEIDTLWENTFPGGVLDAQGRKCALVVVRLLLWDSAVHVMVKSFKCGNSLNNWRSDIGKAGHQAALSMLYASNKYPHDKEGCKRIIADALFNYRFIYEKPDDEVSPCVHFMQCDTKACRLCRWTVGHFAPQLSRKYTAYTFRKFPYTRRTAFKPEGLPLQRLQYEYQFSG